jgi:hypothetical protein
MAGSPRLARISFKPNQLQAKSASSQISFKPSQNGASTGNS